MRGMGRMNKCWLCGVWYKNECLQGGRSELLEGQMGCEIFALLAGSFKTDKNTLIHPLSHTGSM
jgi:hypothetical protein